MGHADTPAFLHALDAHRELVAQEFDTLLGNHGNWVRAATGQQRNGVESLQSVQSQLPAAFAAKVAEWTGHPRVLALREERRAAAGAWSSAPAPGSRRAGSASRAPCAMADWIEPLLRRESYLALLQERPSVHERLLRIFGAARWPAHYLLKHPGVIDELASRQLFDERFDPVQFEAELEARKDSLARTGEDDDEALLDLLRRAPPMPRPSARWRATSRAC